MPVDLKKSAVDLGVVTKNAEPMVAFYRDLLGFNYEAAIDMPGGTKMQGLSLEILHLSPSGFAFASRIAGLRMNSHCDPTYPNTGVCNE